MSYGDKREAAMGINAKRYRHESITAATFVLPGLAVVGLCVLLPMLLSFALSLTHCTQFLSLRWAGFGNYSQLLRDPIALKAIANTCFFTIVHVPLVVVLSLLTALMLNREFPGIKLIRSIYFVPIAVSGVVAVSVFRFIFDRTNGPVNALLDTLGFQPVPWLWDSHWAMWSIIIMTLWKGIAFFSVIILAALQDVPKELVEAAEVDGASGFQRLMHVVVPTIRPVLMTVTTIATIGCFRIFEPMFVLTRGGPADSTRTVSLLAYDAAFRDGRIGYANAISISLLVMILLATLILNWLGRNRV